ncbi:MAG: hypothetical protein M3Q48_14720 [Actinomycetota bacterium]|nr:hypothetical protein [Actinomycetota bacterium]
MSMIGPDDDDIGPDDDGAYTATPDGVAAELEELRRENAALRAQVGTAPPRPVDLPSRLRAASSSEEIQALIDAHNAQVLAANPPPPPQEIDREAVNARIAAAQTPDEVMAVVMASGLPNTLSAPIDDEY